MLKKIIDCLIVLFVLLVIYHLYIYKDVFYLTSKLNFVNENGYNVAKYFDEVVEQRIALKYIKKDDVVLELGGRYGVVSAIINSILDNKTNHVVVDPDETIICALKTNRDTNGFQYHILNKYISNNSKKINYDGYATKLINEENNINDDKKISYEEFKKLYPLKFNVLVADCEGCLCEFIELMKDDIKLYNKILFEADCQEDCDYIKLIDILKSHGFRLIENNSNFVYVFMK